MTPEEVLKQDQSLFDSKTLKCLVCKMSSTNLKQPYTKSILRRWWTRELSESTKKENRKDKWFHMPDLKCIFWICQKKFAIILKIMHKLNSNVLANRPLFDLLP